jgi:general secretion pathway protein K
MTAALRTGLRARRGVALIAALWLVIAIATVALQLSLDAHERRALGLAASERGIEQAAANGALVLVQAKLDQALRTTPSGTGAAVMRASDPWLGVDSIYSGAWSVDSMPVDVQIRDLGAQLNVNLMSEAQLRTFFDWILKDDLTANKITQCILDWRDADSIPRPSGAERDQYIRDERLALPANAPFREVSDLLNVENMTPEIYAMTAHFLRTRGTAAVNVNTAPEAVLRALPGMTDAIILMILSGRSQGRRINSIGEIIPQAAVPRGDGRGGGGPNAAYTQLQAQLSTVATVVTTQIELTMSARVGPQAQPVRLIADITRPVNGTTTNVTYRQW